MNKVIKGLLVTALALSVAQVNADTTNHTYLAPRPHGVNLAMEYTTFYELINRKDTDKFGANFQITGFYQASSDEARLGKYFGINNKNNITLKYEDAGNPVTPNDPSANCVPSTVTCDLDLGYILHDRAFELAGKSVTLKLEPEQKVWGFRFDYYQDLEKILKGLYLTVALPVVSVENNVDLSVGCQPATCGPCPTTTPPVTPDAALNQRVIDYFAGCKDVSFDGKAAVGGPSTSPTFVPNNQAANNKQALLTKGRINGKHHSTGVADIDVKLGYKFLNKENYFVALNLGVTFPTGNEPKGTYLFEPIHGNGQHWGLGFGLDSSFRVWESDHGDNSLKLALMFNYRYLFEGDECRTLGINKVPTTPATPPACPTSCDDDDDDCANARSWGQYHLLGDAKAVTVPHTLIPAANITTLNVDVTPGSQFDGILALSYNMGGFSFDLGYNLYLRSHEEVEVRGCETDCNTSCPTTPSTTSCPTTCDTGCPSTFEEKRYGVATRGFDTNRPPNTDANPTVIPTPLDSQLGNVSGAFGASTLTASQGQDFDGCTTAFLKACDLNTCVAETPSQVSNKLFAGLGYIFKKWDNPLMLGLGGSYEWANSAAISGWAVWAKIGVGF